MKTNLISRMNQINRIAAGKMMQKVFLAVMLLVVMAGVFPVQSALAAPSEGRRTPELAPGRKTPALAPGRRTPDLAPGYRKPALAPGRKTPAITPGRKTPAIVSQAVWHSFLSTAWVKIIGIGSRLNVFAELVVRSFFPRTK